MTAMLEAPAEEQVEFYSREELFANETVWFRCDRCQARRTASKLWPGRYSGGRLNCAHCRQATEHRPDGNPYRYRGAWLARILSALGEVRLVDSPGRMGNGETAAYCVSVDQYGEGEPEFVTKLAADLTPWGLVAALQAAVRVLADTEAWKPHEWFREPDHVYLGWMNVVTSPNGRDPRSSTKQLLDAWGDALPRPSAEAVAS